MNLREKAIESSFIFKIELTNGFSYFWLFLYNLVQSRFIEWKFMDKNNLILKFIFWYGFMLNGFEEKNIGLWNIMI